MKYTLVTALYEYNKDTEELLEKLYRQANPVCICIEPSIIVPPPPSHITYIQYPRKNWKVDILQPKIYINDEQESYKYEIKYFLEKAIQLNPYQTQHFVWESPHFLRNNPSIEILQETPLLFFCKNKMNDGCFTTLQIISPKDTFVTLDILICKKESWEWFMKEYNMLVYQYVYNNAKEVIEESFYSSLLYLFPREIKNIILYDD